LNPRDIFVAQVHALFAGACGFLLMSRLRRMEQHSRFFFITCNVRKGIRPFSQIEFELLANPLGSVRCKVDVALCGYCLMPDHWHAVLLPGESAAISDILLRIKTAASNRIRKARHEAAPIWQPRFYDHMIRTRREFDETLNYMHQDPVGKDSSRILLIGDGPASSGSSTEAVRFRLMKSNCR